MNAGYCCFWVVESGNNFRFISSWASLLGEFLTVLMFLSFFPALFTHTQRGCEWMRRSSSEELTSLAFLLASRKRTSNFGFSNVCKALQQH